MRFSRIGSGTPLDERVLLYWEKSGHVEDGVLWIDGGCIFHTLFDGEALNEQPSHWMPMPEIDGERDV